MHKPYFMERLDELATKIEDKVQKLLSKMDSLVIQNRELVNRLDFYMTENEKLRLNLREHEDRLNNIRIAKTIEGGPQNKDLKRKVNEMLREVDRCIALLNK